MEHQYSRHWSYDLLKKVAIENADDYIEDFKYIFKDEIGSTRNMEYVKTMHDLIDCLERHDALSENNIEPLKKIADQCGGQLEEKVTEYFVPKQEKTQHDNYYRKIRLSEQLKDQLNINCCNTMDSPNLANNSNGLRGSNRQNLLNVSSIDSPSNNNIATAAPPPLYSDTLTAKKRSAIYRLIAAEIGLKYRKLGCELGLRQGTLDSIEIQYCDVESRVYRILQIFQEDECQDHKRDVSIICHALDVCLRQDLRKKIENIMYN